MKNLERYKDIIVDIFSTDNLYRENYREWYRLKEHQEEISEYIRLTFGYTLSISQEVTRLDKYSVIGNESKGIDSFSGLDEYIMLPLILNYLEDKYDRETLLISDMAEHIINNFPEERDWENRKISSKLVRVLKYCQEKNFIKRLDGSEDDYEKEEEEVLYENTGISKQFMQELPYDLEGLELEELKNYNLKELNKVQILRRGLLENFVITKKYPHFNYLLEEREEVENTFEELFGMRLIVFEELAYLLKGEESAKISKSFPSSRNNIERIGLKFFKCLKKKEYSKGKLLDEFIQYKNINKSNFTKGNMAKSEELLLDEVIGLGRSLNIISIEDRYNRLVEVEKNIEKEEISEEKYDVKVVNKIEEDIEQIKKEEWIVSSDYVNHFRIDIEDEGDENG